MLKHLCHLQTLSGHTSPVEYVKFNSGEDLVIAGSQSGTLKIWDPEAAKSKLKYNEVVLNSRKRGQIFQGRILPFLGKDQISHYGSYSLSPSFSYVASSLAAC